MGAHTQMSHGRVDASLYLHPQTLARLGSFELRAKHIVEGVMSGMHRSPHHGFSVEFAQHRQYAPGDDIKHLDWKVYGRSDKLYLKEYQQETNLDLMLLVDSSGSMRYGTRSFADASGAGKQRGPRGEIYWSKFDHATAFAAAMSYIALRQGDRVGLGVYAEEIRALVRRSGQQAQWRQIVRALSSHAVEEESNIGRVVDQVVAKLNNRCLIVILSDFFEDLNTLRAALARIKHRQHDAILFQVLDAQELLFEFQDAVPFEGFEGEGRLRVDPRALRSSYLQVVKKHRKEVRRMARSFGFDTMTTTTSDWLGPPLASFLARRNSILKRTKVS
ncbi:MAG: DUF58 domain-containing protein [Planctomycetota bacterium]